MQSEPVSPPPMTTTCLPLALISLGAAIASSPATRLFCCGRKSIAKWTPSSSRPGTRQSRAALRRRRPAPRRRSRSASSLAETVSPTSTLGAERDALGLHLLHAPVDEVLLHLEVGDAVAQQPAEAVVLLEHVTSWPARASCWRRRGRPGPSRRRRRACRSCVVGRLAARSSLPPSRGRRSRLDGLDRHRVVVDVERARRLARAPGRRGP